jgi:hypothetical protein
MEKAHEENDLFKKKHIALNRAKEKLCSYLHAKHNRETINDLQK